MSSAPLSRFQTLVQSSVAVPALVFALVAFIGVEGTAHAVSPDPNQIYVESLDYGGDGCPQGTAGISISDDRTSFTLIFDSFVASSGPSIPQTEARKSCQLNLNLHAPQGWAYTIAHVDLRGFVQLPSGLIAAESTVYTLGEQSQGFFTEFAGPTSRDYLASNDLPPIELSALACGAQTVPLNIRTQVRINTADPIFNAQITRDSISGGMSGQTGFAQGFSIVWHQCEVDSDLDGVLDAIDNCPQVWNPLQEDRDGNGVGDVCDPGARKGVCNQAVHEETQACNKKADDARATCNSAARDFVKPCEQAARDAGVACDAACVSSGAALPPCQKACKTAVDGGVAACHSGEHSNTAACNEAQKISRDLCMGHEHALMAGCKAL